jgi:hypothetical protein
MHTVSDISACTVIISHQQDMKNPKYENYLIINACTCMQANTIHVPVDATVFSFIKMY